MWITFDINMNRIWMLYPLVISHSYRKITIKLNGPWLP